MSSEEERHVSSSPLARVRELLDLGLEKAEAIGALSVDDLLRHTRAQLLAGAKALGLTGIHRLTKGVLAEQLQQALRRLAETTGLTPTEPDEAPADRTRKFDLGQAPERAAPVEHIPWAYGQDRVTAMVVAPERLYVYWEVSDDAITRARTALGGGGDDAWLALRIYDVTDRIFDGTNAHGYFDQGIARTDRQWFFTVGKPATTAIVELGLRSPDGRFVRIARSGRADFPRFEPSPCGEVDWLTVHTRTGSVGEPVPGTPWYAVAPPTAPFPDDVEPTRAWDIRRSLPGSEWTRWETRVVDEGGLVEWTWSGGTRWEGPIRSWSWESGPFAFPLEPPAYAEERHEGAVTVYAAEGRTHVVYGPWLIVMRGLDARAEKRILGVWELHRSWATHGGEAVTAIAWTDRPAGASEGRAGGASERRWLGGSETWLGGASELYRVGASERLYGGASETLYAGASERRFRGASEQWGAGASELRLRGASERRLGGASEARAGASEARLAGGSEARLAGGSEERPAARGAPDDSIGYPDSPEATRSAKG